MSLHFAAFSYKPPLNDQHPRIPTSFCNKESTKNNSNPLLLQPSSSPKQGSQEGCGNSRKRGGKTMKTGIGFVSLGVCFLCVCVCVCVFGFVFANI